MVRGVVVIPLPDLDLFGPLAPPRPRASVALFPPPGVSRPSFRVRSPSCVGALPRPPPPPGPLVFPLSPLSHTVMRIHASSFIPSLSPDPSFCFPILLFPPRPSRPLVCSSRVENNSVGEELSSGESAWRRAHCLPVSSAREATAGMLLFLNPLANLYPTNLCITNTVLHFAPSHPIAFLKGLTCTLA